MAAEQPYVSLLSLPDASSHLRGGVDPEAVRVTYGPQHARKPHATDARIEERWASEVAANPRIFDGSKFRLQRIEWVEGGAAVQIDLGPTGYKEYLGTNRLEEPQRRQLEDDGRRAYGDCAAHLSNALGCEAVLLTSDDQVVFLRRSAACGINTGQYNGPSGHPEPSHAGILAAGAAAADAQAAARTAAEVDRDVRHELFASVLQEIHEETNVPLAALSPPRLIGCMADCTGKPDVIFLVRASLDAAGVRAAYAAGAAEGWESDHLAFSPAGALAGIALPLTAVTRAAVDYFLQLPPPAASGGAA